MITAKQIVAGRALLGISQQALSQWAGISRATLASIEGGYDSKVSSLNAVTRALEARGVLFTRDGVGIAQRMHWPKGKPADPKIRARVVAGLNNARAARGDPLLVDEEDE
jgi:DNA-binding XRE family transcriptional regulator